WRVDPCLFWVPRKPTYKGVEAHSRDELPKLERHPRPPKGKEQRCTEAAKKKDSARSPGNKESLQIEKNSEADRVLPQLQNLLKPRRRGAVALTLAFALVNLRTKGCNLSGQS